MANTVETKFSVDLGNSIEKIKQYERAVKGLGVSKTKDVNVNQDATAWAKAYKLREDAARKAADAINKLGVSNDKLLAAEKKTNDNLLAAEKKKNDRLIAEKQKFAVEAARSRAKLAEQEGNAVLKHLNAVEKAEKASNAKRLAEAQKFAKMQLSATSSSSGGGRGGGRGGGGNFLTSAFGGIPGGSILAGAVTGGVAGASAAVISEAINLTKQLATATIDLGKAAVLTGAEYERTVKGLAVFVGGIENAKLEISALDKVALNTPGLRLEDAEDGFKRLRALGFSAETATGVVRGLGIQMQLVGATSQDVNRVIVNLIQLSAGSARAAQDVKEMIHSIPSLKGVFEGAFGTSGMDALSKLFQDDPKGALDKFAAELGKAQAAAPGLSSALVDLENSYTMAQRAFAEPMLDPLTNSIKSLDKVLKDNQQTFGAWGKYVGNVITGFTEDVKNIATPTPTAPSYGNFIQSGVRRVITDVPSAIGNLIYDLTPLGGWERQGAEINQQNFTAKLALMKPEEKAKFLKQKSLMETIIDIDGNQGIDPEKKEIVLAKLRKELEDLLNEGLKEASEIQEKFKKEADRIKLLDLTFDWTRDRTSASRSYELGQAGRGFDLNFSQQEAQAKNILTINRKYGDLQIAQEMEYADKKAKLTTDGVEIAEIEVQRDAKIFQIRDGYYKAQIEAEEKLYNIRKRAEEQLKSARDLVLSNYAVATQNPYVTIFQNAAKAIETAKEQTKGLSAEMQRLAVSSAQGANAFNYYQQGFGTALTVSDLRAQADKIQGRGASAFPIKQQLAGYGNAYYPNSNPAEEVLIGSFEQILAQKRIEMERRLNPGLTDEQIEAQADLRRRANVIRGQRLVGGTRAEQTAFQLSQANQLSELFRSADPASIPSDLKNIAAEALRNEADRKERERDEARKLYTNLNNIISNQGIKVLIGDGEQYVRIINESNGRATVSSKALPENSDSRYA